MDLWRDAGAQAGPLDAVDHAENRCKLAGLRRIPGHGIVLARQAAEWAAEPAPLPLYLIFGMLTTKDASGFLRPLGRHARTARAVPIEDHAAYTPQEACARAADVGIDCLPANDIGAALEDLLATQPAPMRILICGSLYLAGQVLARNG